MSGPSNATADVAHRASSGGGLATLFDRVSVPDQRSHASHPDSGRGTIRSAGRAHDDAPVGLHSALARPLRRAIGLLSDGPVTVAPSASPTEAIGRLRDAAVAAAAVSELVREECEVLERALGATLADLPLSRLAAVADAIVGLAAVAPAEPRWAGPTEAHAADTVIETYREDLRVAAAAHERVYAEFTDGVWAVSLRLLAKGRQPRRPIAWIHLHRSLAKVRRTRRPLQSFTATIDLIAEAQRARGQLLAVAPLLASHLGVHNRGPLTDVQTARDSLAAVRTLHEALGDRLDAKRLSHLLATDAIRHESVLDPARRLRLAMTAWSSDVARLGGADALTFDVAALDEWSVAVPELLLALADAAAVMTRRGTTPCVLDVVHEALAGERRPLNVVPVPELQVATIASERAS